MENTLHLPDSTSIRKAYYIAGKRILGIEFTTGNTYHYFQVPAALWRRFREITGKGGSAGSFFNKHIRDHYRYRKM